MKLLGGIPRRSYIACSGGVDSMAALSFVRNNPQNKTEVLFYDHGTPTSKKAYIFLKQYCKENNIKFISSKLECDMPTGVSKEAFWREQRYAFLSYFKEKPIIMAHHLDDVVETYVFSMINGNDFLIPYSNKNIIRPFLLTKKEDMVNWCERKGAPWVEDDTNSVNDYARNRIRNVIPPEIKKINPGIQKVVAKKVKQDYNNNYMVSSEPATK